MSQGILLLLLTVPLFSQGFDEATLQSQAEAAQIALKKIVCPADCMPVDQVKAGMWGYALTVFQGTKPEKMDVEVLGVLRGARGPGNDVILVQLHGAKAEFTGVVAGMSGSPFFIGDKLVGALSLRIGEVSKEPIGGVTPIAEMLEVGDIDLAENARSRAGESGRFKPIEAPLALSGFSDDVINVFSKDFKDMGFLPAMGVGSAGGDPQPDPVVPGSAVSMILLRGDMNAAATCTVTYIDPAGRVYVCGHPVTQAGAVSMPMTKARVLKTLSSLVNSFKIAEATDEVGAFVQDRQAATVGQFGKEAALIPITIGVSAKGKTKVFHVEMVNNPELTMKLVAPVVYNSIHSINEAGGEATFRVSGRIKVSGYPDIELHDSFTSRPVVDPNDVKQGPVEGQVAYSVYFPMSLLFANAYEKARIAGVELDVERDDDRHDVEIESARADKDEVHPGDQVGVDVVLKKYRGERFVKHLDVSVPTMIRPGAMKIVVSDGRTADKLSGRRGHDLSSLIATLNHAHAESRLYATVFDDSPQATIGDSVMPEIPMSVMNVLQQDKNAAFMNASALAEFSAPVDDVVSGTKTVFVNVR